MAEYIEREALLKKMCAACREYVKNAPAADVAPVVRCKECKHRRLCGVAPFMYYSCAHSDGLADAVQEDDFCSYGERKDTDVSNHD